MIIKYIKILSSSDAWIFYSDTPRLSAMYHVSKLLRKHYQMTMMILASRLLNLLLKKHVQMGQKLQVYIIRVLLNNLIMAILMHYFSTIAVG